MQRLSILTSIVVALTWAAPVFSHDFWLIPNAFRLASGQELTVLGQTSSDFPTTLSAVTADRIAEAKVVTSGGEEDIGLIDEFGNSLRLRHTVTGNSQSMVAVMIHPRNIPESAESFRHYLQIEGAPEALERYEREGILPTDSIVRRYAKYAKTLVQVGDGGPTVFGTAANHPLEFVPLTNPGELSAGDELRFRMEFLGEPVPHARGHMGVARSIEETESYHDVPFETDENGHFDIEIVGDGIWNVRALYIVPAPPGSGADWDVHWATFVWGVGDM